MRTAVKRQFYCALEFALNFFSDSCVAVRTAHFVVSVPQEKNEKDYHNNNIIFVYISGMHP